MVASPSVKHGSSSQKVDIVRLTLYTDYSLRVLLYLAYKQGAMVTITELADFYKISRNHLVKVVHNLGIHGFIITTRGKHGGIRLARPAEEISVSDVVLVTEPDFDLLECFDPQTDQCAISRTCSLKSMLYEGRSAFMAVLDRYTLADAAKISAPSKPVRVDITQLKRQLKQ